MYCNINRSEEIVNVTGENANSCLDTYMAIDLSVPGMRFLVKGKPSSRTKSRRSTPRDFRAFASS